MEKLIVHHIGSRSPEDPEYVISRYVFRWWWRNPPRFTTHAHSSCSAIAVVVCVNSLVTNIKWTFVPTPQEFETRGFTLKTHQKFFVHTTPEEFEKATTTGHFSFVVEENSVRKITSSSWRNRLRKTQTKNRRFQSNRFEERFRKTPFSWRISVDGTSNRRN